MVFPAGTYIGGSWRFANTSRNNLSALDKCSHMYSLVSSAYMWYICLLCLLFHFYRSQFGVRRLVYVALQARACTVWLVVNIAQLDQCVSALYLACTRPPDNNLRRWSLFLNHEGCMFLEWGPRNADLEALRAPCHLTEETKKTQSFGHPDMHCDLSGELLLSWGWSHDMVRWPGFWVGS
jgi:hypothetical protein